MKQQTMTPSEVRRVGLSALRQALGPVGTVRFLQQFESGRGDYTREHERQEDHETVRSLAKKIQRWRRAKGNPRRRVKREGIPRAHRST
jgi:hypothetical protein